MDLDPFVPVGIAAPTMRFIDLFLLHCLLSPSPPDTPEEIAALGRNQQRVAARGREPGLLLERGADEVALVDWAAQVVGEMELLANAMDAELGGGRYRDAWAGAARVLAQPEQLPSARLLAAMQRDFDGSYVRLLRARSTLTRELLLELPWTEPQQQRFEAMARDSVIEQRCLEASDTVPFETFRQDYLAPQRLDI